MFLPEGSIVPEHRVSMVSVLGIVARVLFFVYDILYIPEDPNKSPK